MPVPIGEYTQPADHCPSRNSRNTPHPLPCLIDATHPQARRIILPRCRPHLPRPRHRPNSPVKIPTHHPRASRNPPRPSFPRKPESTPPVIPTQAGIHPTRHSHASRNPPHPSFPRKPESTPSFPRKPESTPPVIPTKAGILNSIARPQSVTPADSVPYHSERSEESGNSNLPPGAAIRIRSRIPEFFFRIPRAFPNPPRRRGHAGRAAYLVRARMRVRV